MRIDLHAHSLASDGTDTPAGLVRAAAEAGLDVVALTDHDTTAGWDAAADALPGGLRLIRGMEMSCTGRGEDGRPVAVHLLAYLFDPRDEAFAVERERLRAERVARIRAMAERMADDGLPVDPERIVTAAGPVAGRPHLARALVEAGVVPSIDAAFADLLSSRGRYYVTKADTPLSDAVRMVAAAGGVTVVAHARARSRGRLLALDHIEELAELGLGGLEADHPDHDPDDARLMRDMAAKLDLFVTGSSDYHGGNKNVSLGRYTTDPEALEALTARATGIEVLAG
ncbi:predicted metal-dependent phosphoesterases [Rhodococcus aetherivorans]|uniref:Predicted metal-dependent phosphoesterases n=1 Tax=Rhodococcus aetherivorans TaxID=191292 RepID=A0ABQ0YS36_9NOCA|nr:PHP domain-containing protein [Rhodococcus aetherivorans]ETT26476.1 PHP domain protein [Rhodococcus rhodochrous ATCC 21198]KDE14302.1 metal-dependent phosphoesterase [Rhodococcus aetherivorans]MDV6292519.1 PHP domain-containing protein [Rhodococcus aetherivorans]NGP28796.1 PHP domain-containing protein [Rhodococcus aetherivorans]GES39069.1 predicted metal-dependent phosphoesterases [Rhodococcus aetherivorans]